jgi:hypothetical protein
MKIRHIAVSLLVTGAFAVLTMTPASAASNAGLATTSVPPIGCTQAIAAAVAAANAATAASANAHVTAATATVGVIVACVPKP